MARAKETLERLLYLIPYVFEHQGIKLATLAKFLKTTEKEILKDLHDLFMSGQNEWQQISVYLDKDQRVFVENADFFTRPLSLTVPEAFSLMLAGNFFREVKKVKEIEIIESALKKIYNVIPESIIKNVKYMNRMINIAPAKYERIDLVKVIGAAIKEQKEIEIEYYAYSRDDFNKRIIRPYGLINYGGNWYLAGYCLLRNEERIFRFNRVKSAKKTEKTFKLPEGFDINKFISERMYRQPNEEKIVKIKFDSEIARWFLEIIHQENIEKCKDGSIIATFLTGSYTWIIKWLLPHAEHVQVLEPKFLADEIKNTAQKLLQIYSK